MNLRTAPLAAAAALALVVFGAPARADDAASVAAPATSIAAPATSIAAPATSIAAPAVPAASAADTALKTLQDEWAVAKYGVPENEREAALAALATRADEAVAANPDDARLLTWRGIVLASWAGAKGGLGALGLVKRAKADFEAALAIDERVLDGSAHTSLGSLYYQVPGWPVGFGDDDKARAELEAGLALNPDGIDSNYFWADYLHESGKDREARAALERALAAAPRAGRESADAGRRAEIQALLAKLDG
jgi:tetratricopeptide (TPR) repeat protein